MKVSAQYAAEHFEELASAADRGEEVEIARESRPALMLVPKTVPVAEPIQMTAMFGIFRGELHLSPDWDAPEVNEKIADEFENGVSFPAVHS